jgi:hypothetical protein
MHGWSEHDCVDETLSLLFARFLCRQWHTKLVGTCVCWLQGNEIMDVVLLVPPPL